MGIAPAQGADESLVVERVWPQASLVIFLLLYFVFLWVAWLLAVKVTEPKERKQAAR